MRYDYTPIRKTKKIKNKNKNLAIPMPTVCRTKGTPIQWG